MDAGVIVHNTRAGAKAATNKLGDCILHTVQYFRWVRSNLLGYYLALVQLKLRRGNRYTTWRLFESCTGGTPSDTFWCIMYWWSAGYDWMPSDLFWGHHQRNDKIIFVWWQLPADFYRFRGASRSFRDMVDESNPKFTLTGTFLFVERTLQIVQVAF